MFSSVAVMLAVAAGVWGGETSELCARLSSSLATKAEAVAEACEAGSALCPALAADYHVQLDAHRALCMPAMNFSTTAAPFVNGSTTVSPTMPANVTGSTLAPVVNGSTLAPFVNGSTVAPMVNGSTTVAPVNASCPPCLNGGRPNGPGCQCYCPCDNCSCFWGAQCQRGFNMCGNSSTTTAPMNVSTTAVPLSTTTKVPRNISCGPDHCFNGGSVFPANGQCYCICAPGFYGSRCSKAVPTAAPTPIASTTPACKCIRHFFDLCIATSPPHCHRRSAEDTRRSLLLACLEKTAQQDKPRCFQLLHAQL